METLEILAAYRRRDHQRHKLAAARQAVADAERALEYQEIEVHTLIAHKRGLTTDAEQRKHQRTLNWREPTDQAILAATTPVDRAWVPVISANDGSVSRLCRTEGCSKVGERACVYDLSEQLCQWCWQDARDAPGELAALAESLRRPIDLYTGLAGEHWHENADVAYARALDDPDDHDQWRGIDHPAEPPRKCLACPEYAMPTSRQNYLVGQYSVVLCPEHWGTRRSTTATCKALARAIELATNSKLTPRKKQAI